MPQRVYSGKTEDTAMGIITEFAPEIDNTWRRSTESMFVDTPGETPTEEVAVVLAQALDAHNRARMAMLKEHTFFDAEGVAEALAIREDEVLFAQHKGSVLGVRDHDRFIFPAFQFKDGEVSAYVGERHDIMAARRRGGSVNRWLELSFWGTKRDALAHRAGTLALKDVLWMPGHQRTVEYFVRNAGI